VSLSATAADALYALLARYGAGVPPRPYAADGARLTFAWPDIRVALTLPRDRTDGLKGWTLVPFPPAWSDAVDAIQQVASLVAAGASKSSATNPSSHEQIMAAALHRAGLPVPQRDLQVLNPETGELVSVPDFAWPDARLVLEVDGWFHHHGRDLNRLTKAIVAGGTKSVKAGDQMRVERDARKRRVLARDGWMVMTVTDTEIDNGAADTVAADVAAIYRDRVAS
jgi:very-short-patch-repair endonuclease